MHDLRFALRSLARSRGFTAVALVTLALGIGVNTSMFSVLHALMFRTPYPAGERLVRVYRTSPQSQSWPHSVANFLDHREQNTVFERIAAVSWASYNLAPPGQPAELLRGLNVTADFFPLLGIQPELGRVFTPEEDQPGKNAIVVLSHAAWQQRFGGDPAIIGRTLRINAEPVTVVGVMPARFSHPQVWDHIEAWRPIAFSDQARQNRGNNFLSVVGRLKPGIALEQAQTEMTALAARLAAAHPQNNAQSGLRLIPLAGSGQDDFGVRLTWFVAGLAGFVLLIACANLANLQFARHAGRRREQAIRTALGASRWRLIRGMLTESLLLALAGGALGLLVALWCNDVLGRRITIGDYAGLDIPLNLPVLGLTFLASLVTGLAFGALPAWFSSRTDVNDALKQGARGSTVGRSQHRLRQALIVAEVALALVLLAGAGFFVRGLQRFMERDPGWRTEGLLIGYVSLRGAAYATEDQRRAFHDRLQERLARLPGVERAAFGSSLPTWGFSSSSNFTAEGHPPPAAGAAPLATVAAVSADYFATLGLTLVEGRGFAATDRADTPAVVIINETMARTLWPGESPVGKRIGDAEPHLGNPREIIGVVSDAGAAGLLGDPDSRFQTYRPVSQSPGSSIALALRLQQTPEAGALDLRRAIAEIDPDLPAKDLNLLRREIDLELASPRLAGHMLAGFGLLGLLLAAVGIYGVISGFAVQRTNEIGIRMALGAQIRDILALVLGKGLKLALLGAGLGLGGAYGIARLLRSIAPGLPPADPATAAAVTLLLLAVAAFACWLPARRATKVDPVVALRAE